MAKKQLSFAEKAKSKKVKKEFTYVKLIRSVKTESGDGWRFNEQILGMIKGENIDSALKRLDDQEKLVHAEMLQIKSENAPEEAAAASLKDEVSAAKSEEPENTEPEVKAEKTEPAAADGAEAESGSEGTKKESEKEDKA